MERVLVATDDSEEARKALEHALDQFPDATIHVVHVPEPSNFTFDFDSTVKEELEEEAASVLERAEAIANDYDRPGTLETELVFGHPAKEIVTYADDHDVEQIVTGSQGVEGAKRILLGSVAEAVVRRANCPVTVVR